MSGTFHSRLNQHSGRILHWEKDDAGISGSTEHARFRIRLYGDSIVRVQLTREDSFEDFSYAVIAEPVALNATVSDTADAIKVATPRLVVEIDKNPLSIRFLTPDGDTINEDDHAFGTSWIGEQVTTYKKLQEGERFIGLGEKTGPLDRRGNGYVHWNTDNYGYSSGADPLYLSTPFFIGVHHGLTYGIFLDNTHKSYVNFGASNNRFASFGADAGEMNYYFFHGNTVGDVIREYTHVTGRMEIPPRWSIGYQQCRYSYYPDTEVMTVANTFREKDIPADVIVLDIHYMEQYKIFTWSKRDFPDPAGLLSRLKAAGFHVVVMCDPGIRIEEGYHTYEDGLKNDVFIKYPDGTPYAGEVWPGWCHFPDFTRPATRVWWQQQFQEYVDQGVSGFWNDMNEIATWGNMLPEHIELDFEGERASMRRGRNIFGFQMARSTYEGTRKLLGNKRPFNLTRSGFSGIQRYAAVWTGDNVAYDEHMMLGVRMVSSMGMAGIAFAGYDVGGFVGDANTRLFARWLSIGAFSPFFRGHSAINTRDSEPWSYGEEVEQIARNYIRFRYQLLPYLYALFFEAATTGMPVQRSLAIEYPHDSRVYDHTFQHQYLFGPSIMVVPVESTKDFTRVFLPPGNAWYSLYDGSRYFGESEAIVECPLHRLPVFVKAGAIIPMQPAVSHTGEKSELLIIHLYAGESESEFLYYDDDGESFEYQTGAFLRRILRYEALDDRLIIGTVEGSYQTAVKRIKVVMHGFQPIADLEVNGKKHDILPEVNRFFTGLEKFDPIKDPEPGPVENVQSVEFPFEHRAVILSW